ncbi:hypothetical protein BE17_15255 [Sorangium cellulosum]|uniref:HNH nuclease domain-containing protein n=1 Tax=Sorangium cellulosum TaxID=56 RepID=A0A150R3B7_SORCE|nr:hypothetical protein BE17_15255 [Sorangium cellulosum]
MAISMKTKIMLWGRAAHRCSFPGCRRELAIDAISTDDASLIGEVCHIIADSPNGPRGASPLTAEERDRYSNLILLCNVHHKVIDDLPGDYPVERLHAMKEQHERWVRETLQVYDDRRQREEETYATYIDEWAKRCDLDEWSNWSSSMLGFGQPSVGTARLSSLRELSTWLFGRVWPRRYLQLEAAFENFRRVLADLLVVFAQHAEERGNKTWTRSYEDEDDDPDDRLLHEIEFHVDLVMDLMAELTRAANYVCDRVRQFVDPSFRAQEGLVLAISGPYEDNMSFRHHRFEYRDAERVDQPYPGLVKFKGERKNRDWNFGEGEKPALPRRRST